jgi:flagellar hook-associated protein 2
MAGISSAGLGSGLDINSIISQLMAVEQQPLTALATKEASFQAKLSAFGSLKGALSALQTTAKTLTTASTFTGKSANSSDSTVLTTSATSTAAAGNYSISVNQLAKFHAVRSNTNYAATTDTFNTGTLSITVGSGTAVNVTIDSSNNTLAGIRDAINSANAGVTASVINADIVPTPLVAPFTTNRLVLTSTTLGSAGAITVAVTDSGSGGTNALTGLASASLVATQTADDAKLTINGIAITRASNTITDAVDGLTLNLLKGTATTPGTASVTVAQNTGAVTSAVNAFVKAYNDAISGIKTMTAYDAANKKASVLTGDTTARSIQTKLSSLVQTSVTGIAGGISRLSDIGITVQKDGTLATNSTKLAAALADTNTDVASLFTQTTADNEGIAVRFNTMLEGVVGSSGLIASRTDGINASIKDLGKRADALNLRLVSIEKRYRAQFTALDTLVASMNQTSTYLTQQLANLPGSSSNN